MSDATERVRAEVDSARKGAITLTIGFVACAVAASYLLAQYAFHGRETGPIAEVIVFKKDVLPDDRIRDRGALFKIAEWPESSIPDGAIRSAEELEGYVRILKQAQKDEPVLRHRLAREGNAYGIADRLNDETRGFILEATENVALSGVLQPGSVVDVIASFDSAERDVYSTLLLEGIPVLAVGSRFDPTISEEAEIGSEGGSQERIKRQRVITLMVTTEQAKRLALAKHRGEIDLALRDDLYIGDDFDALKEGGLSDAADDPAKSIEEMAKEDESVYVETILREAGLGTGADADVGDVAAPKPEPAAPKPRPTPSRKRSRKPTPPSQPELPVVE